MGPPHPRVVSLGRQGAVAMASTRWWVGKSARERAETQAGIEELVMPLEVYKAALTEALGRPVFTTELADGGRLLAEMRIH